MVVLGLGSNHPNKLDFLRNAIWELRKSSFFQVNAVSPLYESDAMLPPDAPSSWNQPFLNLALVGTTLLTPSELLRAVKNLEGKLGRLPGERWAPREIDIDILIFDSLKIRNEELEIPHPSLFDRPFALLPMLDIIPSNCGYKFPQGWRTGLAPYRTRRSKQFLVQLIGILNVTPDSFSDGGKFFRPELASERMLRLAHDGCAIVDVGAESTRPGAEPVQSTVEWSRLEPVIRSLSKVEAKPKLSVDTRHPDVAHQALELGVDWINDVSGVSDGMISVVKNYECDVVFMHSLTVPADRKVVIDNSADVIEEITTWAQGKIARLADHRVDRRRVIFDPGIGFGKTAEQSREVVRRINAFRNLGVRILVGHSRKSFLEGGNAEDRDQQTAACSIVLARKGVDYLRVHNPELNRRQLETWALNDGVIRYDV